MHWKCLEVHLSKNEFNFQEPIELKNDKTYQYVMEGLSLFHKVLHLAQEKRYYYCKSLSSVIFFTSNFLDGQTIDNDIH